MDNDKPSPTEPTSPISQSELFALDPLPPAGPRPTPANPRRDARLLEANRGQIIWGRIDLEGLIAEDHPVRAIWAVVERLDLSALYEQIGARCDIAGRPAIDPKILLALWIYATSKGEGSAREIQRLTQAHSAYRWICGGVEVGYHTISDFRSEQGEVIDNLITQVLAILMQQNLVDLSRVAQDGTRIRASAGTSSFRRKATLETLAGTARKHLEAVKQEACDPSQHPRRKAARERGAADRLARLERALEEIPDVIATKKRNGKKDPEAKARVSTTDPEARVMKMAGGGFRPAFNIQFATTTDSARVIVGVEATNRGTDMGESTPMLDQIERRTGQKPAEILADGGYPQHEAIDQAAERGAAFYSPVPKPPQGDPDPYLSREGDSQAVRTWRKRMATQEAKEIYKQRAATAETVNADAKAHRGLDHISVRGCKNAISAAGLFVLTYDIARLIAIGG